MTDTNQWLRTNSCYLSAALFGLRLLLEQRAREVAEPEPSARVPVQDNLARVRADPLPDLSPVRAGPHKIWSGSRGRWRRSVAPSVE